MKSRLTRRGTTRAKIRGLTLARIERLIAHAYSDAWPAIVGKAQVSRKPRIGRLEFAQEDAAFLMQVTCGAPHRIQVSRAFTRALGREFEVGWPAIRRACLPDAKGRTRQQLWLLVSDAVIQLSTSFVVLHEIFHVLCGHIADYVSTRGATKGLAFGEAAGMVALSLQNGVASQTADATLATLEAYYLEVEADNSALQWIMQGAQFSRPLRTLANLFQVDGVVGKNFVDLPLGWGRVIAFRALIVAIVVTVRLLERQLGAETRIPMPSHPYPMARLHAAVNTIMEQYADITDHTIDADGSKVAILTETQAEDLKVFLTMILKPVVSARWPARDAKAADDGFEIHALNIATELDNTIHGRKPSTEPVLELLRIQTLRGPMTDRLRPHRYIGAVITT